MKRALVLGLALVLLLTACGNALSSSVGTQASSAAAATTERSSRLTTRTPSETTPPSSDTPLPQPNATATTVTATDVPPSTTVPITDAPVTDVPTTDAPATDAPVTNVPTTDAPQIEPPPVTDNLPDTDLPAMGALTAMEFENREILYTTEETPLFARDGSTVTVLSSGHAVVAVERTDRTVTVLYRGWLCELEADQLTAEVPAAVTAKQDAFGGIYYSGEGKLIAIDPGHQGKAMTAKEPLGPGSDVLKAMLTAGTAGVSTRIAERELNLRVALLLRDELISRGYGVVMIRESHEVTLSNAQRAQIANAYGAAAFVRIHANGSTAASARGAETLCQTASNPYNGALYAESRLLSDCILEQYCARTGIRRRRVIETDTMTGINWAEVPVTIIEMGFMSNAEEDELMATDAFRKNAALGIADGLDAFLESNIAN